MVAQMFHKIRQNNERKLYEGDKNDRPFWKLTDKEQEYYKWLFNRDKKSQKSND